MNNNFSTSSLPLTCSRIKPSSTDGVTCKCMSHAHALAQCLLIEPLAVICDRPIHQVRQRTHRSASASATATRRMRPDVPFPIRAPISPDLRSHVRETFIAVNNNNMNSKAQLLSSISYDAGKPCLCTHF